MKHPKRGGQNNPGLFSGPRLTKLQVFFVALVLAGIFILTYSPHFSTHFPIHDDEWHYIDNVINLGSGNFQFNNFNSFEIGFDLFLLALSKIVNLIFAYQFLAAIWAVLSGLVLFLISYHLSKGNFTIALFSLLFFGSIKSGANFLGLQYFTALSFAIPFIFLYIFFFIKGLQSGNKKYLWISLAIMLLLIPIHAISVLFALPFLLGSLVYYRKNLKNLYAHLATLFLVVIAGVVFYSIITKTGISAVFPELIKNLAFSKVWESGPLPENIPIKTVIQFTYIPFTAVYSFAGYLFALLGMFFILKNKIKVIYPYLFWPAYPLFSIILFLATGYSFLSPYSRSFYYLAIGLPLLSSFGLYYSLEFVKKKMEGIKYFRKNRHTLEQISILIAMIAFLFAYLFLIIHTVNTDRQSGYTTVTMRDYQDLIYLSNLSGHDSVVLAPNPLASAVTPVSGMKSVGSSYNHPYQYWDSFFFYQGTDCSYKDSIIKKYNVSYVISSRNILCNYPLLRSKYNFIYNVSAID